MPCSSTVVRRVASYREFTQHYPQPGWVEHDATEIWDAVVATLTEVIERGRPRHVGGDRHHEPARDRGGLEPLDRRAVRHRDRLAGPPHRRTAATSSRRRATSTSCATTGLVLDPYFSGTKFEWLLEQRDIPVDDDLALGTIDAWLIWNLTGGEVFATDVTNASRTMLFDIGERQWNPNCASCSDVPIVALPEVRPSSGRIGVTSDDCGVPAGIPVSGVAGDQQAALFGQACVEPGMAKNTYGTGSFVLLNVGDGVSAADRGDAHHDRVEARRRHDRLRARRRDLRHRRRDPVAARRHQHHRRRGRDRSARQQRRPTPAACRRAGVRRARIAVVGSVRPRHDRRHHPRHHPRHITRAVVESMAYQIRDVVDAMVAASGTPIVDLRVDGGASVMDLLLQIQADQLGVTVRRPVDQETTALGAAFLAGLAEGVWPDLDAIAATWHARRRVRARPRSHVRRPRSRQWLRAVERSRNWVEHLTDPTRSRIRSRRLRSHRRFRRRSDADRVPVGSGGRRRGGRAATREPARVRGRAGPVGRR